MDWVGIVVAGLAATAVITMLMYAGPVMGMLRMDIAQLLGSMVLPQGSAAFAMGMMVHFVMGIIFAIIYALAWQGLGLAPNWWTGLIFGAVHAVVAAAGIAMMMPVHKEVRAGRFRVPSLLAPRV